MFDEGAKVLGYKNEIIYKLIISLRQATSADRGSLAVCKANLDWNQPLFALQLRPRAAAAGSLVKLSQIFELTYSSVPGHRNWQIEAAV